MNNNTLDLLKLIIDKQLNMPEGRVWAYNGTQDLPQDAGLFIVLQYMTRSPFSNNIRYKNTENGLQEVQTSTFQENILISCISQNTDARDRVHEVLMALKSTYAQYIQEKYHIHLSTTEEIVDSSFLEATSRMNRFDVKCSVIRGYDIINDVDYYDKFPNTSKFEPEWLVEE